MHAAKRRPDRPPFLCAISLPERFNRRHHDAVRSGTSLIFGRSFLDAIIRSMVMTKLRVLGAACLAVALAAASPAMARGGGHMGGGHMGGGHMGGAHFGAAHVGGGAHFAAGGVRGGAFHGGFHRRGFGPGIAAGVVAGAALGGLGYYGGYTPYGDSYAYDYDDGYAPAPYYNNGQFVCQPGTYFVGEDGLRHLCQ
jgi:hypothetical protein